MINFSILGNGGMSQSIQDSLVNQKHVVSSVVERGSAWQLDQSDMVIECTNGISFLNHATQLFSLKKDVIIVSTGWYDEMDQIKSLVEQAEIRVIWSSNFSIGVQLYFKIVRAAAQLINNYDEYDVWATEIHHKNKIDSPSGTAKELGHILIENMERKTDVVTETLHRTIEQHEIHFSSTRGGAVNFGHTIGFDSAEDVIKIEHQARNRNGYALGVVKAAEWLKRQQPGFYSMDDFLAELTVQ